MDLVISLDSPISINNQVEFIWDGRLRNGKKVANGVYFCRLNLLGKIHWTKIMVINS